MCVTLLFDTSKQFITFLIEMITNSYNLIVFLPKNVNPVWNGKIATFSTKENYNDTIKANFRAYDSLEESVNDLGNFLNVNSRYRKHGLFDGKNYIEQAQALEDAGYSTKKNSKGEAIYADLLIELIKDNNLMIIDSEAVKNE